MLPLAIRPAQDADLPAILDIMNDAILNTTAIYDYNVRGITFISEWFDTKQKLGFPVLVATRDNEVLGYASYGSFRNFDGFRHTVEHSVYLRPEARGYGFGKLLLTALIAHARTNKHHVMIAGIDAENLTSIALHESLGFSHAGTLKESGFKFNRWLDLVFMQLTL